MLVLTLSMTAVQIGISIEIGRIIHCSQFISLMFAGKTNKIEVAALRFSAIKIYKSFKNI